MQLVHFDRVNVFLNSIKEIIWQTEAIYRCPLKDHLRLSTAYLLVMLLVDSFNSYSQPHNI